MRSSLLVTLGIALGVGLSVIATAALLVLQDDEDPRAATSPKRSAPASTPRPVPQAARFVDPRGDDAGPCTADRPCASFARAFTVASPGELVEVATGVYPAQQIPAIDRAGEARVRFRPAARAEVIVDGQLDVFGRHVEVTGMRVGNWYVKPGAHDVVLRELDARGAVFITSASKIAVLGGRVGPAVNRSPEIKAEAGSSVAPRDVLIQGVEFHDFTRTDPTAHVDCLHVLAGEGLVFRGNRFRNCEAFSLLFTEFGEAGPPRDILVENNFFSCCRSGYYALYLGGGHGERWKNVMVRNNSSDKAFTVSPGTTTNGANVRFHGNVGPSVNPLLCGLAGVEWDYNVWASGEGCGPHDRVAPSGFRDAARLDFHLEPGAAALGAGHPASAPTRDIDGQRRRPGGPVDAGADQSDAGASVG